MARGKISLAESVNPEEIIDLGEVVGMPNFIIEEDETSGYGIDGNYKSYSLVEKKVSYRTGKDEKDPNNNGKVIRYIKWTDVPAYVHTLEQAMETYMKIRTMNEFGKLEGCKDISEVIKIQQETQEIISNALSSHMNSQNNTTAKLEDSISKMRIKLSEVESIINEADSLHRLIKEKRSIIIGETEEKKRRLKLED